MFKGWGLLILAIVLLGVIGAGVFAFSVVTAGVQGRGQAHIQQQSATNRILQQAGFEQQYADIQKYDRQIVDAGKAVEDWDKANAGKEDNGIGTLAAQRQYLVQTQAGLRQQCQTTVENYNANARKYLAADFKAADLPDQLSLDTHCK